MKYKLSDICSYYKKKVDISGLTEENYISTENMIPDKNGVTKATSLPTTTQTQGYGEQDILVSNIRPYFKKIWFADRSGGCSNDVLVFRANKDVDSRFLYYVLADDTFFEYSMATSKGTKMPRGDKRALMEYEVPAYGLEYQKKIAGVLSALDEKIQLNTEINKNLYQQLFALYDYYRDSADDGEIELGALCQFQEGYVNPAQTHPEYFDGDVKWLRAVDINESFIIETSRTLTQTGFQSAKKSAYLFSPNTIAISKSGTIGRLGIVGDYMCGNRAVINIAPKDPLLLPYIYAFLKSHQKQFPDLAVGSVQKNLYVSLLEPLPVRILAPDSLSEFCNAGNAILNAVYNNCQENIRLAQLRDTLLPRLMTGELDVSRLTL